MVTWPQLEKSLGRRGDRLWQRRALSRVCATANFSLSRNHPPCYVAGRDESILTRAFGEKVFRYRSIPWRTIGPLLQARGSGSFRLPKG